MPKLEARYRPWPAGDEAYVVVGHVIWDASGTDRARVQPAAALRNAPAPRAILATLRHLVSASRGAHARLTALRNRFWSFVPALDAEIAGPADAPTIDPAV